MRSGAAVAVAAALSACASGSRGQRDEDLERIDAVLGTDAEPEEIPDGISLGVDAPPLAGSERGQAVELEPAPEPRPVVPTEPVEPASPREEGPVLPPQPVAPSSNPVIQCSAPPHGALLPAPVPRACFLHPNAARLSTGPGAEDGAAGQQP